MTPLSETNPPLDQVTMYIVLAWCWRFKPEMITEGFKIAYNLMPKPGEAIQ